MKYDLIETGKRIAEVRKQNGLTQEAFGEQVHITKAHLARIENGRRGPSIELLVDISCEFDVSLDYLILGRLECNAVEIKAAIRSAINSLNEIESKI